MTLTTPRLSTPILRPSTSNLQQVKFSAQASAKTGEIFSASHRTILEEDFGPLPENIQGVINTLSQAARTPNSFTLTQRLTAAGELFNLSKNSAVVGNQDAFEAFENLKPEVIKAIDVELEKPDPFQNDKYTLNLAAKLIDACQSDYNTKLLSRINRDRQTKYSLLTKGQREAINALLFKIKMPSAASPGEGSSLGPNGWGSLTTADDNGIPTGKRWRRYGKK